MNNIQNEKYENKLTIALDLDGTLISEISLNKKDTELNNKLFLLSNDNFNLLYEYSDNYYINLVFIRPKLYDFLEEINKFAHIIVFTARERKSAIEVVKFIDPKNKYIKDIYARDNLIPVDFSTLGIKDLQVIAYKHEFINMKNIVLIDDWWYINNYYQIFNFLPIKQWSLERFALSSQHENNYLNEEYLLMLKNDNEFMDIILPFLKELNNSPDVRNNILQYHKKNFTISGDKLIKCVKNVNQIAKFYKDNNMEKKIHEIRKYKFIESQSMNNKIRNNNIYKITYNDCLNEIKYNIGLFLQEFSNL